MSRMFVEIHAKQIINRTNRMPKNIVTSSPNPSIKDMVPLSTFIQLNNVVLSPSELL